MLLATVLLSAALAPQAPPAEDLTPFDEVPALEATPAPDADADPPAAAAPIGPVQEHIAAGLKAFIRGRFTRARDEFEKAYDADPQSAAAAFYLGYACYKLGEPSRHMNPDKQRARELFAKAYELDPTFQPVWGQKKS